MGSQQRNLQALASSGGYRKVVAAIEQDGHVAVTQFFKDERIVVWQMDEGEPVRVWVTFAHSDRLTWDVPDYRNERWVATINRKLYFAPEAEALESVGGEVNVD